MTCRSDVDCPGGFCDQELCFDCGCAAYQDCEPGRRCVPGFSALAVTRPAANAFVSVPFKVVAELTRKSGGKASPPSSLSLSAKPGSGVAESFTLERQGETLTYSKTISPKSSGGYSLTASFAEAGLASAPVSVTIKPVTCEPACGALEECVGTTCIKAFEKIEITSPLAEAKFTNEAAGIATSARIIRSAGVTREFPATVDLTGTSGLAALRAVFDEHRDGVGLGLHRARRRLQGPLAADGRHELAGVGAVAVAGECGRGAWEECSAGKCVAAFTGIAISAPSDGAMLAGSTQAVRGGVRLQFRQRR